MCLIAIKKKGVKISGKFYKGLSRSFHLRNSDGCGYAVYKAKTKQLYFKKAIYHIDYLIHDIKKHNIEKDDILVVHLRKTSGSSKCGINTHPFIMTHKNNEILKMEGYTNEDLFFHNGTFNEFISYKSIFSDTLNFVKNFANNKNFTKFARSLENRLSNFNRLIPHNNKVVILSKESGLVIFNRNLFIEDENKFLFSNDSFKKQIKVNNYSRSGYAWENDIYD